MTTNDTYTNVTASIVAMLESGVGEWRMPWHSTTRADMTGNPLSMPYNAISKNHYRGINVPLLWGATHHNGFDSPAWATYKQWHESGAQVRKGERATTIIFWKQLKFRDSSDTGEESESVRMMARAYSVFNAAQVDGNTTTATPIDDTKSESERIDAAETFFAAVGATVNHGGNRAFFAPSRDTIQMPAFAQFKSPADYYSTLGHEHVHYTGTESRCHREFGKRFGDNAYAFEELVAELGAAFLCAQLGISNSPREDHAAYLQSWLHALKDDKRAIFTAASKAQQACDWLNKAAAATLARAIAA